MAGGKRGKGRASKPAPLADLRTVYGSRLAELRERYEGQVLAELNRAEQAGADHAKVAALRAKLTRRASERDYNIMAREFRREVSNLRKAGLVPKEVKAASARPTRGLLRRIENSIGVARGEEKAVKLTKKEAAALKDKYPDIRIKRGRAILDQSFTVKGKGEAVELARENDGFVLQRRAQLTRDPEELEAQVRAIFAKMKEDELVTMRLGEFNLSRIYGPNSANAFLAKLLEYQRVEGAKREDGKYGLRYLTIVKLRERDVDGWLGDLQAERFDAQRGGRKRPQHNARRAAKRAQARAANPKGAHRHTPKFPPR